MKENIILNKTFQFAVQIIDFCEILIEQRKFAISNQLLRSGTSIGANVREAQNPHSRAVFISKMVIAMKEADETGYWLQLCKAAKNYPNSDYLEQEI